MSVGTIQAFKKIVRDNGGILIILRMPKTIIDPIVLVITSQLYFKLLFTWLHTQFPLFTGRSHDKSFTLFRLGQKSSVGVRSFAETGRSDLLEEQSQGEGGIYDEFNAPPITSGVGRTEAEFFVDGNHSRVSSEQFYQEQTFHLRSCVYFNANTLYRAKLHFGRTFIQMRQELICISLKYSKKKVQQLITSVYGQILQL